MSNEPSSAGSCAAVANCRRLPAAVPALSVAAVPSPKVALAATALVSSTKVDPNAEIPCACASAAWVDTAVAGASPPATVPAVVPIAKVAAAPSPRVTLAAAASASSMRLAPNADAPCAWVNAA